MEGLRDILMDAIDTAKKAGVWQSFSMTEKKALIEYFYLLFEK